LKVLGETLEPGCEIGMEACGGAHHWARELKVRGFEVKLIAPQFVKPFIKSLKKSWLWRETAENLLLQFRDSPCDRSYEVLRNAEGFPC
jgi:hypothetical protein